MQIERIDLIADTGLENPFGPLEIDQRRIDCDRSSVAGFPNRASRLTNRPQDDIGREGRMEIKLVADDPTARMVFYLGSKPAVVAGPMF